MAATVKLLAFTLFSLVWLIWSAALAAADFSIAELDSKQLVIVITDNENAITGRLSTFTKGKQKQWHRHDIGTQVVVGRTGTAWGKGLHPAQQGPQKLEGDGKAPAGIFRLGDAFGYFKQLNTALNYSMMTADDYCIDINKSPLYNQIVSKQQVGQGAVEGSSEPMRRDIHKKDNLYKKGIIVHHNPNNISGQGSCIFMHLWRSAQKPTAGCTAMTEEAMDALLQWLDASKKPLLITLTTADYMRLKDTWQLPQL